MANACLMSKQLNENLLTLRIQFDVYTLNYSDIDHTAQYKKNGWSKRENESLGSWPGYPDHTKYQKMWIILKFYKNKQF
jgi:hypothetical protein